MRAHTRTLHTEKYVSREVKHIETPMSIEDLFKGSFGDMPTWAVNLRGFRNREGLTQADLSEIIGTPQTNISKMELGKRPIGKNLAKRLAELFKTDYRLFL